MTALQKVLKLINEQSKSDYELEKLVGLKRASINNWRSGKANPSADALAKIADYFSVSVDYLLGRTETPQTITLKIADSVSEGLPEGWSELTQSQKDYIIETIKALATQNKLK